MKKTSMLLFLAVLTISSCGTVAQWGAADNGQNFQDGIYSNSPSFRSKEEKEKSKSETDALIAKTKESPIYLFGDKKDTVMIPENFSARIQYDQKVGGTVVTVGENPYDWRWDLENRYGYYYGPYSLGSSWYWSRHYDPFWNPYWYSWGYSPWRYYSYYDPWYYGGFYDPWYYGGWYGGYYGGWYNPWYYTGYWGWHDPWYHHHHHHGWYDPHHHGPSHIGGSPHHSDRYYGLRANTERRGSVSEGGKSGSIRTNGGTIRGGMSRGNTRSRSASTVRRTNGTVSRPASATRPSSASSVSASRSATMTRSATGANYRRPSSSSSQSTVTRDQSGYSRSSSYGSSSSSYERSSSSSGYNRSSSGYSRSGSSSSYSRSSGYGGSSSGSSGYSRGSSGSSSHSRGSSGGYRR